MRCMSERVIRTITRLTRLAYVVYEILLVVFNNIVFVQRVSKLRFHSGDM